MGGGKGSLRPRVREGFSKEAAFKLNPKEPVAVGQIKSEVDLPGGGNGTDQASEAVKHVHLVEQMVRSG